MFFHFWIFSPFGLPFNFDSGFASIGAVMQLSLQEKRRRRRQMDISFSNRQLLLLLDAVDPAIKSSSLAPPPG